MRNTISKKFVVDYIVGTYGEMRQDPCKMVRALNETAKEFGLNKKDLFFYIIERKTTVSGSQSYGFDTRYGRHIRETFSNNYYN